MRNLLDRVVITAIEGCKASEHYAGRIGKLIAIERHGDGEDSKEIVSVALDDVELAGIPGEAAVDAPE